VSVRAPSSVVISLYMALWYLFSPDREAPTKILDRSKISSKSPCHRHRDRVHRSTPPPLLPAMGTTPPSGPKTPCCCPETTSTRMKYSY
jgi:hypothetical protein